MREATVSVYTYKDLDQKARKRAHDKFLEHCDYSTILNETLHASVIDLLEEQKIGQACEKIQVYYSLGYSQGDGVCFIGKFDFRYEGNVYIAYVEHTGRYYHKLSVNISIFNDEDPDVFVLSDTYHGARNCFKKKYYNICDKLEREGYEIIEQEESEENFEELCNINNWEFFKNGTMFCEQLHKANKET